MKYLFGTILLLLFATSCNKNAANINILYNRQYFKQTIENVGKMRLFVRSGEIKDAPIVNRFWANDSNYYKYLPKSIMDDRGFLDTILLQSRDTAIISAYYLQNKFSVTNQPGQLLLTANQSTTNVQNDETFSQSFNYYARQVKPTIIDEYLLSSAGGHYYFGYVFTPKYVLTQASNASLAAPVVAFFQHKANGANYPDYFNGSLGPGFNQQIPVGDTVSLTECKIIFNN